MWCVLVGPACRTQRECNVSFVGWQGNNNRRCRRSRSSSVVARSKRRRKRRSSWRYTTAADCRPGRQAGSPRVQQNRRGGERLFWLFQDFSHRASLVGGRRRRRRRFVRNSQEDGGTSGASLHCFSFTHPSSEDVVSGAVKGCSCLVE